jgi:hypothetical protein
MKRASFRLEMVQLQRTWAVLSRSRQDWGVRDNAEAVGLSATRVHRSFPKEPPFRSTTGKIEARLRPIETINADLDTTTAGNYRLGWLQGFIDQDRDARSEIRRLERVIVIGGVVGDDAAGACAGLHPVDPGRSIKDVQLERSTLIWVRIIDSSGLGSGVVNKARATVCGEGRLQGPTGALMLRSRRLAVDASCVPSTTRHRPRPRGACQRRRPVPRQPRLETSRQPASGGLR